MTEQHPITPPPPKLVEQWLREELERGLTAEHGFIQAARWGADQELEACCEWLRVNKGTCFSSFVERDLRDVRRPKPPSLKAQALQALGHLDKGAESQMDTTEAVDTIRRALEKLND